MFLSQDLALNKALRPVARREDKSTGRDKALPSWEGEPKPPHIKGLALTKRRDEHNPVIIAFTEERKQGEHFPRTCIVPLAQLL